MDDRLKESLETQLHRLVEQLADLNSLRDGQLAALLRNDGEMSAADEEEFKLMEIETNEQLTAFTGQLERMTRDDVKLEDELGAMKMAIRAAIADAFKTPEVIRLFALQQPGQLRERLTIIQRDMMLQSKHQKANFSNTTTGVSKNGGSNKGERERQRQQQEIVEILTALRRLGEPLHDDEIDFLKRHKTQTMADFEKIEDEEENGTRENNCVCLSCVILLSFFTCF